MMRASARFVAVALRAVASPVSAVINRLTGRQCMSVSTVNDWSIGIYKGTSPLDFFDSPDVPNPVLTAGAVTDVKAEFVADPFWIKEDSNWYMFFEVMNGVVGHGEIGLATSTDGYRWKYQSIVLREPFHLSYPFVVKWNNEFYIIPESEAANRIGLYRAKDFPFSWEYVQTLVEGLFGDHSLFRYQESWWLLAGPGARLRSGLRLFYADELTGPWIEHPKSPVVRNDSGRARPGGRTLVLGNTIVRYAQDCAPTYGRALNAFEITALTKTDYRERPVASNPVLQPGNSPWTMHGIHQLDAHELREGEWIACVDGYKRRLTLAVEY